MAKLKARSNVIDPDRGPLVSVRFVIAILLMLVGIAWIVYYYAAVRVEPGLPATGSPHFMAELKRWNYLIGFGLFFIGLLLTAHPSTPLGRNRGVVVGMLSCFLLGLAWICTFYIVSGDSLPHVPVFNDLDQYNLVVGICFMGIGFAFATRWE